jgi:pimeloyl-ACP methyl ester carboxylesterase
LFGLPGLRQAVVSRSIGLPIGPEYERLIVEDIVNSDKRLALDLSLSSLEQVNLKRYREELLAIRANILLVVGDKDKTIPPKGMYNIKSFRPESELVPFPKCGHLPMLEQPERFARVLMDHFALVGSKGVVLP